jgi:hypothetical protein
VAERQVPRRTSSANHASVTLSIGINQYGAEQLLGVIAGWLNRDAEER